MDWNFDICSKDFFLALFIDIWRIFQKKKKKIIFELRKETKIIENNANLMVGRYIFFFMNAGMRQPTWYNNEKNPKRSTSNQFSERREKWRDGDEMYIYTYIREPNLKDRQQIRQRWTNNNLNTIEISKPVYFFFTSLLY